MPITQKAIEIEPITYAGLLESQGFEIWDSTASETSAKSIVKRLREKLHSKSEIIIIDHSDFGFLLYQIWVKEERTIL